MTGLTLRGGGPLYLQIQTLLTKRISSGEWSPGQMIPSEIALADELSVSQGTVRKAINDMVSNNLLVRHQGKGTYVATHDTHRALFHFFHIVSNDGHKVLPDSHVQSCKCVTAGANESSALNIDIGADLLEIRRIRHIANQPIMSESIHLSNLIFRSLCDKPPSEIPNNLYQYYEHNYGITIYRAEEKLRAVSATKIESEILKIETGMPLIEIERIAYSLDGTPIELRVSRCATSSHFYQNTVF